MPPDNVDNSNSLQVLLDKSEIHDVLMRYCRGVDRADGDLVISAFHADATGDLGGGGPAEWAAKSSSSAGRGMMHFTGNEYIEFFGDVALSEVYFISFQTVDHHGRDATRIRAGRYVDRFERRRGEWKIAYHAIIDEWSRLDEVNASPAVAAKTTGRRSRDDLVYRIRDALAYNSPV